ncbi:glutathione peroxidase [Bacillus sp. FJAT-27225]|uniref:glutathione peroxidase n=1 Tax=Bacillus sp. FJAT-27225 TaxID=1743144 RepID=UPI00080C263F|nr:glutathione peroxidase [Bacillus sp. FJAT-27225]OCA90855.1 glutathione peroxidase [Bacillus sp. FJAT-27225]
MSVYEFKARTIKGKEVSLHDYEGKVLLIVNTASKCGFTPQYEDLQELYAEYEGRGFAVLGFPSNQFGGQEPGTEEQIESFCSLNYGVTFPIFAKVDVKGDKAHPLFEYLSKEAPGILGSKSIKWNFTKFLVDRNGKPIARYASTIKPNDIKKDIEKLL